MEKKQFIEKIKKEISSLEKDITKEKEFAFILEILTVPQEEKDKKIIELIEHGLEMAENTNPFAPDYFLTISELPDINADIRSFCMDAMLVAEYDLSGEFKSLEELRKKFSKIKAQY
jgi:hypothetical protein